MRNAKLPSAVNFIKPTGTTNTCERNFGPIHSTTPDISREFHTIPPDNKLLSNKTCTRDKTENSPENTLKRLRASKENSITIAHLNICFLYNNCYISDI